MVDVVSIKKLLSKKRFNTEDEKILQGQIEKALLDAGISFQREFNLDEKSCIDFMVGNIGIEVKIKGQKRAIYKQCERYCTFDALSSLLLLTSKSMGIDEEINGKPIHYININRGWL